MRPTFRTDEAPADVDVLVVLAALAWREVARTEKTIVCQHQAARCHAVVISVVGHGAPHAPSQPTWGKNRRGSCIFDLKSRPRRVFNSRKKEKVQGNTKSNKTEATMSQLPRAASILDRILHLPSEHTSSNFPLLLTKYEGEFNSYRIRQDVWR